MSAPETQKAKFGPFVLDFTVTIPDLLAIFGSLVAIILAWNALSTKLELHTLQLSQHDKEISDLRRADEIQRNELRSDLKNINDKLDRLVERK